MILKHVFCVVSLLITITHEIAVDYFKPSAFQRTSAGRQRKYAYYRDATLMC